MNRIILLGRLVRDPEVRVTPTEKTVCTFTLAVDRPFASKNGQREADFINIVTWNKTAELCGNSLTKGQRALVEGRLQIRSYDGKDGNPPSQNQSSQGGSAGPMGGFGSEVGFDEEIPF